jgi:hypothetical protein
VYLEKNRIELRPGDFYNVSVKEVISLHYNKISDITPFFDLANSPEELRLYSNDLSKVTAADLQHLTQRNQYLSVHNCNLTTFPDFRDSDLVIRSYSYIPFKEEDNNMTCDCRLWWVTEMRQIQGRDLGQLGDWECAHPASLRGKRMLDEVSLEEFCPGKEIMHQLLV